MANKDQYEPEQIERVLRASNGYISQAANILHCTRATVMNYVHKYPYLEEVLVDCREAQLDFTESKLHELINGVKCVKYSEKGDVVYERPPDTTAVIFNLKTRGKGRGYSERPDNEKEQTTKIVINFKNNE